MSIHLTSKREHGAIRPLFQEKPGGATETVARTEIEKLRSTGLSLMPEGLERQVVDPQQMADLIAYLMTAK